MPDTRKGQYISKCQMKFDGVLLEGNDLCMGIMIDANASIEYTSRGYTFQFVEEGTKVHFDELKY